MNVKRFLLASLALFVFIFAYETLVHGFLLKDIYSETANIWRNYDQMREYFPFNILKMALITLWITFIFTRLFKEGGWQNGMQFGLYFGVLDAIQAAGSYYYLPIPAQLAVYWFLSNIVEGLIGGFLIGLIYRKVGRSTIFR